MSSSNSANNDRIELTATDEWLLQAVRAATAKGGASLADVIAWADALNHAIFTPAELRSGFAKLLAARYIAVKNGEWFINEHDRNPNVIGNSKRLTDPELGEPGWSYPLSDSDIHDAVISYQRRSVG